MEIMTSPYELATDSPSRQLLYELGRLAITTRDDFYARLDRESGEREAIHRHALATAAAEHNRVRRRAEQEREKLELELQIERERLEDEKRRELERLRLEEEERLIAEKKEADRVRAVEAAEKKKIEAIAAREAQIAEAERKQAEKVKQDAEIEKQRKDAKDAEKKKEASQEAMQKAKEVAIAAQKRQLQTPVGTTPTPQGDGNRDREAEHQRYVNIHQNLKQLRKFMMSEAGKHDFLKQNMGNMRREIKKSVGQITEGKGVNKTPFKKIISIFKDALQVPEPKVEITMFLANPPSPLPSSDTKAPGLLIYLVNILAKAVISQFINEAGVSPKTADPVGVLASNIFALDDFRWQGISLIDILISKMHVVCPVLWGIYGDESTAEGKSRLGWSREEENGHWVSEQRHQERMTGLGAGFASLALRKYEKARAENPYPNFKYWQSFAAIVNVPQRSITATHLVVLKAMIEGSESKFLELFGNAGLVALRVALIEYPAKVSRLTVAAKALAGLADVLRRDKKLNL